MRSEDALRAGSEASTVVREMPQAETVRAVCGKDFERSASRRMMRYIREIHAGEVPVRVQEAYEVNDDGVGV